ncbi:hypothetical protein Mar181_3396 [Marinomonas posidonica IVIA-Po-181]|uniref:DUF3570 domain-containing protein n=1 Tax=Marinomonas posidonica (strain CECT 7376 / NCIMB 14433 / IVIA-Po-181) TaxID=491952 RepID=F6CUJ2_MARPP|nr:hypothetical protein Mar181_3396 [Marinomonas posidonica IVIA-Po-181]
MRCHFHCCLLTGGLLVLSNFGYADDLVEPLEEEPDSAWWQSTHTNVSRTIGRWSNSTDAFLSGKDSDGQSDSFVRMRFGPIFEEEDSSGFFDFSARMKLPNTEKRLRFVIESNGDSIIPENELGESSQQGSVVESAFKTSFSAAVNFVREDLGADFDAGVLVDFPLDPFMRLRFNQGHDHGGWRWYQKQEGFAYYSKGVGARYGVSVSLYPQDRFHYGADFSVVWLDQEGEFYGRENVFAYHAIDDKNSMSYQLSFLQSGDHSLEPDSFLYNVQYERRLYRDWLSVQLKPQFTHEAEDDYQGKFSLTMALVILLGPQYLK